MCIQGCYNDDQWSSYTFRGFWSDGWYSACSDMIVATSFSFWFCTTQVLPARHR